VNGEESADYAELFKAAPGQLWVIPDSLQIRIINCDCDPLGHHRWNCYMTPIWAQTIRDLDINPWTVVSGTIHRFGLDLTSESFDRLHRALEAVNAAERRAWGSQL
jgi:hypothetical protein